MTEAALSLVLHAHLPWVRHPELDDSLEERWLFEALRECYLPLLGSLRGLSREGVAPRLALSLSPPLIAMLRDAGLRRRFERYADRVGALLREVRREGPLGEGFGPALDAHEAELEAARALWVELDGDVVAGFVSLARGAGLELFTTALTHAWLPGLRHHPAAARAQVRAGLREFREATGLDPRGFWLPECGWLDGVDRVLAGEGVRWTVLEAHGLLHATPAPRWGLARPSVTRAGVAVFGRDPEASRAVWSREVGYPGHPSYRDFHSDAGFTLDPRWLGGFMVGGARQFTGLKPWRVTGGPVKEPWDPTTSRAQAETHAEHFVREREAWARWVSARGCGGASALCPYDAELFGHWWRDGTDFIEAVLRRAARSTAISAVTPTECLDRWGADGALTPAESTWGEGGYGARWLAPEVAWSLRPMERGCAAVTALARDRDPRFERASRELSLALSSDWAFLAGTSGYAARRWRGHLAALDDVLRGVDETAPPVGRERRTETPRPWPSLTPADFFTEDER